MNDDRELHDWRDTFTLFDKTGDGYVACNMIGEIMRAIGQNPTQCEINMIIKEIDQTGKKRITFEDLAPLLNKQKNKLNDNNSFESFCEGFKIFDRENNGMVSVAEIRNMLVTLGEQLSSEEIDILLEGMEDNNGMINYEEFVRNVMNG